MDKSVDLLDQRAHFAFGENWADYARQVTEGEIQQAVIDLRRLGGGELTGKRFLDIGCGSGLHALAALRLGASEVVAVDIDPQSVATARRMLQEYAGQSSWRAFECSVFDLEASAVGTFDVVYSWGVLHHTGDMRRALRCAAALVAPGGVFMFALYRHTRLCWFWSAEKRWYAAVGPRTQAIARGAYICLYRVALTARGRSFSHHVRDYRRRRGMNFYNDVHDWMGGWPYESISPPQTDGLMRQLGMLPVRAFAQSGTSLGVFGSGCDEYVYGKA